MTKLQSKFLGKKWGRFIFSKTAGQQFDYWKRNTLTLS